jgi:hypothetical protein
MFGSPSASPTTKNMYAKFEQSSLKNSIGHFFGGHWPLTGHVWWSICFSWHKEPVCQIWTF